jgi:hypothetical protein
MYALVEDNEIKKIITNPKPMIIDDVQYPAKIFQLWSEAELNAIGIYEVITDSSNKKDEQYYINTNEQFTYANDEVTRSWGTPTPRRLEDQNATDEDGIELNPVIVIKGLKSEKKDSVKNQASALLSTTDWYVVKANEVEGYTVPENITNFRSDVRAKSNEMETQIDACTTVDELKTLYEYVNTGTEENPVYERPLAEFPKEVV